MGKGSMPDPWYCMNSLTLPGQLAPVYLDYVMGLLLGSGMPYSPAKDTATPSHSAVDCLLSLMIRILIRL